jgi:hypothetical protein
MANPSLEKGRMMKLKFDTTTLILIAACLLVTAATAFAQPAQPPRREPLGFLKRAIADAGAPELTADQETQLTSLIRTFHESTPSDAEKAAHRAFNDAILAGDLAGAQAQAGLLAQFSSAHLQSSAKLQIDILNILKTGGQLDALKAKFGEGLIQILGSVAGGPGFGGPGRPGGGPGGPGGGPPRTPPGN